MRKTALLSLIIYALTSCIGIVAFLYPFWIPTLEQQAMMRQAHADDAPLMLTLLVAICFVVMLLEVQGQATSTKLMALLGMLIAINALLRFIETAFPMPGGFSPIFFLIMMVGYIFGARLGFLMGALTLLVSSLITGLIGPWLPYQMFTAGWLGMSAPLCRPTVWVLNGEGKRTEVIVLALFSGFWGLAYGLIMNIWFWPFATGPANQYWEPGIALSEIIMRYATFYLATSLVWDVARAIGNLLITLTLGLATLRALRRFQTRFTFEYQPTVPSVTSPLWEKSLSLSNHGKQVRGESP